MKWFKELVKNVTLIGDSQLFNEDDYFQYSSMGFGTYKGMSVSINCRGYYKSKEDAINKAESEYKKNQPFSNGDVPFEVVFYNKNKRMWCCMTSNLNENERMIRLHFREKIIN